MKIVWTVERKDRWPAWLTCFIVGLVFLGLTVVFVVASDRAQYEGGCLKDPHDTSWVGWLAPALICLLLGLGCVLSAAIIGTVKLVGSPGHKRRGPTASPVPPHVRQMPRDWK